MSSTPSDVGIVDVSQALQIEMSDMIIETIVFGEHHTDLNAWNFVMFKLAGRLLYRSFLAVNMVHSVSLVLLGPFSSFHSYPEPKISQKGFTKRANIFMLIITTSMLLVAAAHWSLSVWNAMLSIQFQTSRLFEIDATAEYAVSWLVIQAIQANMDLFMVHLVRDH